MTQALRVLHLLRDLPRIQGSPQSTATALAEAYDTSERTIYRDIDLLQEAGYPVANQGNGYYLLPTDRPVPVELNADEIAALCQAVCWVHEALPTDGSRPFAAVLHKLASLYGTEEAVVSSDELAGTVAIQPHLTDGPVAARNIATALRARRQGRKLHGTYQSPGDDAPVARVLHPYCVVYRGDAHYLIAFCELRSEQRTFRLDRFHHLEVLEADATIPGDYDLEEHFSGAWQVTAGRRHVVQILLRGQSARRLMSQRVHPSQKVLRKTARELELEFHVAITDELRTWILGLGPDVEVLAPASLRRDVREKAILIAANYATD